MKLNKVFWKRGLVLCTVLIFSVCLAAGFMVHDSAEVRADDPQLSVTLTPEQTFALFGDNFTATYYDSTDNRYYSQTFDFVTLSSAWIPSTSTGPDHNFMFMSVNDVSAPIADAYLNPHECLVYKTSRYSATSNTGQSNNTASFNMQIPLSVSVPSTFAYLQNIYYGQSTGYPSLNDISVCDVVGEGVSYSFYPNINSSPRQYRTAFTPVVESMDWNNVVTSDRYRVGVFHLDVPYRESAFSINSITLKCNRVTWHYNADNQSAPWEFYIFIECPTLTGYTPPVVTTAPPVLTGTGATQTIPTMQTIDLSNLESGVAAIIQNQYEIGALSGVMALQLNTIIGQLNAIYAEMVKDDLDLPSILHNADPYPTIGTNIVADIDNALTSYTFAQFPSEDIGNGADGLNSLADGLGLYDGVWLAIGVFCIGYMIFCWFVFRGRGGV